MRDNGGRTSSRQMPFTLRWNARAAYSRCMQYTIRRIPGALDSAIRERARVTGFDTNAYIDLCKILARTVEIGETTDD